MHIASNIKKVLNEDLLETKTLQRNETRSLCFIESVHLQYCNGATLPSHPPPPQQRPQRNSVFKLTQNEPNDKATVRKVPINNIYLNKPGLTFYNYGPH